MKTGKTILLTFDVEEWFQVENFKGYIPFSSWDSFESRVEKHIHTLLDLLDSFSFAPKATFFLLGWIAKRQPGLVKEIHNRGHEIASHGFNHHLCTLQAEEQLAGDLKKSKHLLEEITGNGVYGYRAPSFAINRRILETIREAGYLYDSSYNSFAMHGRYGVLDLSAFQRNGAAYHLNHNFYELPLTNLEVANRVFPLGGGGYFRLMPFFLFKQGMKRALQQQNAFVFYAHPWEFDPGQPRVKQASPGFRFRHYINLNRTEKKLNALINTFKTAKFTTCRNYLKIRKG